MRHQLVLTLTIIVLLATACKKTDNAPASNTKATSDSNTWNVGATTYRVDTSYVSPFECDVRNFGSTNLGHTYTLSFRFYDSDFVGKSYFITSDNIAASVVLPRPGFVQVRFDDLYVSRGANFERYFPTGRDSIKVTPTVINNQLYIKMPSTWFKLLLEEHDSVSVSADLGPL